MKTISMTQQATMAFGILTMSSSSGREMSPVSGATIGRVQPERRLEVVRHVLDAFATVESKPTPVFGLAALLR